jgi:hypothetical protein
LSRNVIVETRGEAFSSLFEGHIRFLTRANGTQQDYLLQTSCKTVYELLNTVRHG